MRKVLKWIGIGLVVLIGVLITAALVLYFVGGAQLNKTRQVQPAEVSIPTDAESLARGEHLVNAACKSCHGADLSGVPILDDPAIGTVYASNISGFGELRSDEEMVLATRHGIGQDDRQLIIMPAESFINFSEEDLGAIRRPGRISVVSGVVNDPIDTGAIGINDFDVKTKLIAKFIRPTIGDIKQACPIGRPSWLIFIPRVDG